MTVYRDPHRLPVIRFIPRVRMWARIALNARDLAKYGPFDVVHNHYLSPGSGAGAADSAALSRPLGLHLLGQRPVAGLRPFPSADAPLSAPLRPSDRL